MAKKKTAKKATKTTAKGSKGFSTEERAAMKEYAKELKKAREGELGEKDLLAAIAAMKEPDRTLGKRLHAIVKAAAPSLSSRTWYGMPAYANEDGKVVCYYRCATKFKERYAMFGFNDSAKLDDGSMWPIAFALTKLTPADEKRLGALVKKAVG